MSFALPECECRIENAEWAHYFVARKITGNQKCIRKFRLPEKIRTSP